MERKNCKGTNKVKYVKESNGITLIALVITIIVLLILAGVTIATLTGENGILTRANNAKTETEEAKENELRRLTALEAATNLETYLYEDENEDTATIPAGFAVSQVEGEKTVREGLVVIDSNGNEFVWIPANVSEMATLTNETDSNGNPNYQGKLYNFPSATISEEKTNYGQGTTSNREPDIVSSYDEDTTNNYLNIINEILGTTYNSSDTNTFLSDMQKDYNAMIKSVEEYGGFYIGRYEISKSDSNNAQSKRNSIALTADDDNSEEKMNGNTWYGLYAYGKKYSNTANSVISSMVWGSQYDVMMRWMQANGTDVTSTTVPNQGVENTSSTTTGFEGDTDVIRNIYDIYGGRFEWTLEAYDTDYRVFRGGNYFSSYSPRSRNGNEPYLTRSGISSRLSLYVE